MSNNKCISPSNYSQDQSVSLQKVIDALPSAGCVVIMFANKMACCDSVRFSALFDKNSFRAKEMSYNGKFAPIVSFAQVFEVEYKDLLES